ncbi:MAG: signal recognition particle protein [Thermodesulfobacteriota bacterium]
MFDSLSGRLNKVFKDLRGHGTLTEKNIQDALREVRLALLEADVNYKVVKDFIAAIREKAVGIEVLESLSPGQQVIKIVHQELIDLLGGSTASLNLDVKGPAVVMMVGLQGSGKTTSSAKLAKFLKKQGRRPYLVPADVYRPAAIEQLKVLGQEIDVAVHPSQVDQDPLAICKNAAIVANQVNYDTLILDTAGRLHVDKELMAELARIKNTLIPSDILFVADAMTGQDAVTVTEKFNQELDISGVILTKMEGDARGGAALSIAKVAERPIKFVGTGEGLADFEIFHPDRLASRILGMGDVLSLIEKAEEVTDKKKAEQLSRKIQKRSFTLEDFLDQVRQVKKMGSLEQLMGMIPGLSGMKQFKDMPAPDDRELVKIEAIISSMTPRERRKYQILNGSRRKRIARGSGTSVTDVNKVVKSYTEMLKMMQKMQGKMGGKGLVKGKKKRKRPKGLAR